MIVKNCPSCVGGVGCASAKTTSADCNKVENFIMKQIVSALAEKDTNVNEKILKILFFLEVENGN